MEYILDTFITDKAYIHFAPGPLYSLEATDITLTLKGVLIPLF